MNIRFLISAAVAALSISVFAQAGPPGGGPGAGPRGPGGAQRGPGGGGMRRGMPDELKKQLALTADQQKKIDAIQAKYRSKFQDAFKGMQRPAPGQMPDKKTMDAMRAKMKPLMDARQKEIDAVLTPKQRDIMKKWRAAHPPRMMGGPGGPGAPGKPPLAGKPGGLGAPGKPPLSGKPGSKSGGKGGH